MKTRTAESAERGRMFRLRSVTAPPAFSPPGAHLRRSLPPRQNKVPPSAPGVRSPAASRSNIGTGAAHAGMSAETCPTPSSFPRRSFPCAFRGRAAGVPFPGSPRLTAFPRIPRIALPTGSRKSPFLCLFAFLFFRVSSLLLNRPAAAQRHDAAGPLPHTFQPL